MNDHIDWHILVIDDEQDILDVMVILLEDQGDQVVTALDGKTGLDLCREEPPHILITDIRMPGMTGIEVLEAVKDFDPDIEVIVCTAFADMELAIQALQLDASDFITKPVSAHTLNLALKRAKERFISKKKLQDYARFLERQAADQAQILHQDKMMSLGRLAASVVHEINNPLSGILNYIRLMSKYVNKGSLSEQQLEKFKQYLNLVETETDRCSRIVSSLLAFSRKSPPAMTEVNINEIIEKCAALSQHKLTLSNISLDVKVPAHIPLIQADANQLQQCLINLIFNAIDAMPNGGELHISCHYHSEKSELSIVVTDTGVGIPDDALAHVFEPFFTTKQDGHGVGLGLSTAYGIIERHNGRIVVQSQVDRGTRFTITLPVNADSRP
jgi:signal transduction histidine kinase